MVTFYKNHCLFVSARHTNALLRKGGREKQPELGGPPERPGGQTREPTPLSLRSITLPTSSKEGGSHLGGERGIKLPLEKQTCEMQTTTTISCATHQIGSAQFLPNPQKLPSLHLLE